MDNCNAHTERAGWLLCSVEHDESGGQGGRNERLKVVSVHSMQVPESFGVDSVEAHNHVHIASGQSCRYLRYSGKDL